MQIIYVDDSGSDQTGFVTYSWVAVAAQDWSTCLRRLITWRRELYTSDAIAVETELHATKFLNGRGDPSHPCASSTQLSRRDASRTSVADATAGTFRRSHLSPETRRPHP
ncbi:hypothetical protein SAMN06264364_10267 [Quadrisphaera granulorum]|uniref:DUF3800 domain-containing protein n=1 Tax=Quadrisphaera granulorum TaxID=317664 RepID=A0A316AFM5_9ACTN|nr:hypothetical protein BXY45_10267 [Quadrisphaera granulorum]SZE95201.1 hypothetical protein SAMN06264364_10267 [Quadrisphaera granulorum]